MSIEKHKALEIRSSNIMEMLIKKAPNRDIIKAMANITIADIAGRFPAISALKKQYPAERVETALATLIVDASGYFEHAITETQALDVAAEISAQYYYLSLEDVYLALSRLKSEQIYGRLTPNKILNVTCRYADERAQLAAQRNLNEHLSKKESRLNYDTPDFEQKRQQEAFTQYYEKYKKTTPNPSAFEEYKAKQIANEKRKL